MKATTNNAAIVWTVAPSKALTTRQVYNRVLKIAELEKQKKELDEKIKSLRAEIIGDADALDISDARFSVKYTPVLTSRLDTKRLKTDHPDIYAQYEKETASTRFSYTLK